MRTCLSIVLLLSVGCSIGLGAERELVWLETEQFNQYGGWTNDAQFVDQMGSPYLMAVGLGKPVADARTTVNLPRAGRYRLWARTKDWAPKHHPGRFRIVLAGRPDEHVFGESGQPGWRWESGGIHDLSGRIEVRLADLSGFYARCDAIVLSADLDWTPPAAKDDVAPLREQFGGVSRQVEEMGPYDVVVVGGGLAGCMAAVSSARMGAKTVLIQNRPVLGGNASVEILVPPVGVWPHGKQDPLDPRETGLVEEIRTEGNQTTAEAKLYSGRLLRLVSSEPNLDLHLNCHVTGVEMQADKTSKTIGAVVALDVRGCRRMRFSGRVFIDCTGDGSIGVWAGAEHRHGREPRSMYGESMANEQGDRKTMGNSLKYVSQPTNAPLAFEPPPWAMKFPRCEDFTPGRHPRLSRKIGWQWMIELGGNRDTYLEAEEIRDDVLRLVWGIWDHVKNHCPKHREKAACHELVWVGHVAGKRENRRLIGDYVLNQNDIVDQTLFADRVAYGGWGVDDHYPDGFLHDGPPAKHDYKGVLHSIPLRSLYSANVDNLLMAGRNISASHVAMSAARVMLTCAVIGQASGTAAAMCVEHDTTPRGIYRNHLGELQQQLLKGGAHIIDLPSRDPRDLARAATVTASSEQAGGGGKVTVAANVTNGFSRAAGGKTNAWCPDPDKPGPPWIELSWDRPMTFNLVHITFLTKRHAPTRFQVQAWRDDCWRTLAEVSENKRRRHVLAVERTTTSKLRVVLLEADANEPGICEIRVYDEPDRLVEIAQRAARTATLPDTKPELPWDDSVQWITGIDPKKLAGIVIDDTQTHLTGRWCRSEYGGRFIVEGYLHDCNSDKGKKTMRFSPNLAKSGEYEVRIAYTAAGNRASNTPVTVKTSRGSKTVRIDQRKVPPINGLFRSLGTFHLDAGSATSIVIGNADTDGYVAVDALQLVPVE